MGLPRANMAYMTQQVSFLREMVRENLCCSIKPKQSIENDPDIVTIPIDEAEPLHLRMRPGSRGNSRRATWVGPQAERPRFPGPPARNEATIAS